MHRTVCLIGSMKMILTNRKNSNETITFEVIAVNGFGTPIVVRDCLNNEFNVTVEKEVPSDKG